MCTWTSSLENEEGNVKFLHFKVIDRERFKAKLGDSPAIEKTVNC